MNININELQSIKKPQVKQLNRFNPLKLLMRKEQSKAEMPAPPLKKVDIADLENTPKTHRFLSSLRKEKPLNHGKLDDTAHILQRLMRKKPDKAIHDSNNQTDIQQIKKKLKEFSVTELEYLHGNFENYPQDTIKNNPDKRSIEASKLVLADVLTDKLYKETPHNTPEYIELSERIARDSNILLPYGIGQAYKALRALENPLNMPTPKKHFKNIEKRKGIEEKLHHITEKHDKYSQLKLEYGSNIEKIDKDIEAQRKPSQGESRQMTDLLSHITAPLTAPLVFLRLM